MQSLALELFDWFLIIWTLLLLLFLLLDRFISRTVIRYQVEIEREFVSLSAYFLKIVIVVGLNSGVYLGAMLG